MLALPGMARRYVFLALLASAAAALDPVGEAADTVSAAFRAGDSALLRDLAGKDKPDPWLVAEELCCRGEHDAAEAFARAAPRKDVESLPAHVASRRVRAHDAKAARALAAINDALTAKDYAGVLKLVADCPLPEDDPFLAVRLLTGRSTSLRELARHAECTESYLDVARVSRGLGWISRTAMALTQAGLAAYRRSDFRGALAIWEECLPVEEGRGDRAGMATALASIGECHRSLGEAERALEWYGRALALREELKDHAGAARTLAGIGATHGSRRDYAKALECNKRSLALEEQRGDRAAVANALTRVGDDHRSLGNHAEALEHYGRALGLREELKDQAGAARALASIAALHESLRDYAKALEHYGRALSIREELKDQAGAARLLTSIAALHDSRRDYPKALECHERSLALKEALGDRTAVAWSFYSIGDVRWSLGDHPGAIRCFEQSLKLAEELGARDIVASCLTGTGNAHISMGDYPKALEFHQRSVDLHRQLGDAEGEALALNNIGAVHHRLGDYTSARSFFERSLELYEKLGDPAGEARALGNIGSALNCLGESAKALDPCRRQLKAFEELEDRQGIAAALRGMASVLLSMGDYPAALDCLDGALKLMEALGDRAGLAAVLRQMGTVRGELGDHAEAVEYCVRSLTLIEPGDRGAEAGALMTLGSACHALGEYPRALEHYERSLKLSEGLGERAMVARALGNVGAVHEALGDYRKALDHYDRVFDLLTEIGDRGGAAIALVKLGGVHRLLDDPAKALEYSERGLAEAEQLGARDIMFAALLGCGRAHRARGNPASAIASSCRAVGILGQLSTGLAEEEGARARERFVGLFDLGVEAAVELDDPAKVSFFLESGRAATLLEALGGRAALRAAAVPEELRAEEAAARVEEAVAAKRHGAALRGGKRDAIREARRDLDRGQEKVGEVIAKIQRQAKTRASVVYPEADSLDAIRGRVREGEALVLYGLLSEEAVALVITRGEARIVRLGSTKDIAEACAGDETENAEAIARLVIEPLALREETHRVLVSPAGALSYVPFALQLGGREVAYVPSGTTYGVLLGEGGLRGEGVLALGDPASGKLPPLPGSRAEAKAVGDVVLLGEEATEAGLLAAVAARPRWRAIHLACHGLIDPERPLLSSLMLSGEDALTTLEVFRANVPADLVVLSACETARGKVYRAEGVVGFVRAFMFAGAPRVLVSLWNVDDEATRALMARFYAEWKMKPAATALRAAQAFVASHEKWKHPRYWAAWQLWGLPE